MDRAAEQFEWRAVAGFEGLYKVAADGRVMSLGRETVGGSRGGPCTKRYPAKIISPVAGGRGRERARVNLYFNTNGSGQKKRSPYIVDLVRAAFGDEAADALPVAFRKSKALITSGVPLKPMTLTEFIRESNRIERIYRAPTADEIAATARFLKLKTVTITDLIRLVKAYQPEARPRFVAGMNVTVQDAAPISGGPYVQARLASILENKDRPRSAYEMHVEYEILHPFTDCNGRSGRALWLWSMGGIEKSPLGFLHHFYYQVLNKESRFTAQRYSN